MCEIQTEELRAVAELARAEDGKSGSVAEDGAVVRALGEGVGNHPDLADLVRL